MLLSIFKLAVSLITGYLFIKWCPVIELVSVSDIIVELVLDPVKFFASSIAFMAGFLINADLIKKEIAMIIDLFHGEYSAEIFLIPLHIGGFYLLSIAGLWQTLLFLCLALVYGMISVDFSGNSRRSS
ncbi:hypothetical protein ACOJQI_15090 [Bacillus salacetis]|uniref:hypothetical protein n=1 Tax=Bacillus salacetis TaxID=2315464 RepID=UPI003BA05D05